MTTPDRDARWLDDLLATLETAELLVGRGRDAYDRDPALRLAFEALSSRVGEAAKRLFESDPARFADPMWSLAARNRDLVAHHYDRIDPDLLWRTVAESFPALATIAAAARR